MDRSRLLKRFKAALRRAGVREITFHDLRHAFGTHMAAAGVPLRTLQAWMGHEDIKTTMIYSDYMPPKDEADQIESAMAGIGRFGSDSGSVLSQTEPNSAHVMPANTGRLP